MAGTRETIWFIGEARDSELRFCLREIEKLAQGHSLSLFAAIDEVDPDGRPSIVVAFQDWSSQYREGDINRLLGMIMPAGRLLAVYGSWCESDGRNTDLWPHGVRVSARNAPERFERELQTISHNEPPLPLTASRDERFEHNHSANPPESLRRVSAAVVGSDRKVCDSLASRLNHSGIKIEPDARICDTVVWAPAPSERSRKDAVDFVKQHKGRRIVAVMSMPHAEERSSWRDAGISELTPMLATDRQLLKALSDR